MIAIRTNRFAPHFSDAASLRAKLAEADKRVAALESENRVLRDKLQEQAGNIAGANLRSRFETECFLNACRRLRENGISSDGLR